MNCNIRLFDCKKLNNKFYLNFILKLRIEIDHKTIIQFHRCLLLKMLTFRVKITFNVQILKISSLYVSSNID